MSPERASLLKTFTILLTQLIPPKHAKMQTLGRDHQVICITHLSQVAAADSTQFVVTKDVLRGRTYSSLREVTAKARREEIARMLGGKSESALELAANLLNET